MAEFAGALGDGGNHRIAVGNGFVAGRLYAAGELLCGLDGGFFHSAILAWRLQDKNFTTAGTGCTEFRAEGRTCPFVQFFAAQLRCRACNLFRSAYVLSSAGETLMFARGTVVQIAAKAGMLFGALLVFTVLLAALPAHRAPAPQ